MESLFAIIIATLGAVGGFVWAQRRSRKLLGGGRSEAVRLRDSAERDAARLRQESQTEAQEARQRTLASGESESVRAKQVLEDLVERLAHEEKKRQRRVERLTERDQLIKQRRERVASLEQQVADNEQRVSALDQDGVRSLERAAGRTEAEIETAMVEQMIEQSRLDGADRLRNLPDPESKEWEREAKRLMGVSLQRYEGHCPRERSSLMLGLEPGEADRLRTNNGKDLEALGQISGVAIQFADDDAYIRLESGDGVARELCRRAIIRFFEEKQIKDATRLIEAIKRDLEREIVDDGRKAFRRLKLEPAAPEIVDLVGRLMYRTSYTQNQHEHSIESGHLCGLMAAELRLDPAIARRGALLHDIGKSLTHVVEGSHALLGAELARKTGELEIVANAIGYHHGEEPCGSAYAPLVAAADAMSGARPGARREAETQYDERIGELQKIAGSFRGVLEVHAVQAGRELRVHVDQDRLRDDDLNKLAGDIVKRISDEVVFPGQVKVTVIREFRAVEVAQ